MLLVLSFAGVVDLWRGWQWVRFDFVHFDDGTHLLHFAYLKWWEGCKFLTFFPHNLTSLEGLGMTPTEAADNAKGKGGGRRTVGRLSDVSAPSPIRTLLLLSPSLADWGRTVTNEWMGGRGWTVVRGEGDDSFVECCLCVCAWFCRSRECRCNASLHSFSSSPTTAAVTDGMMTHWKGHPRPQTHSNDRNG